MSVFKSAILILLIGSTGTLAQTVDAGRSLSADKGSPALQVRVTGPVLWLEHCLSLRIDRTNRSNTPLWIPNDGLYVDTSITELSDKKGRRDAAEWVNVLGVTDLIDFDSKPIAPGSTLHENLCLPETVAVVNRTAKTRRQIELRGRLRIAAFFFLTERDYLTNKAEHEAMFRNSGTAAKGRLTVYPEATKTEISIPCRNSRACRCDMPALLLYGESPIIPDIFAYRTDWNKRGKRINGKLAHKQPPCSDHALNSQK